MSQHHDMDEPVDVDMPMPTAIPLKQKVHASIQARNEERRARARLLKSKKSKSGSSGDKSEEEDEASSSNDEETPPFSVKAYNSYTASTGGWSNPEYAWAYMVEPFRATTLEVEDPVEGATYQWTVDGHVQGYGRSVEVAFTELGRHSLQVEELVSTTDDETDEESSSTQEKSWTKDASGVWNLAAAQPASTAQVVSNKVAVNLMAKYVRREVRTLTDADREAWLSAVMVMQRLPTTVGQSLYGDAYKSKDHFTRLHLYYGGSLDCDHWHEGAGFVTSHVALTLEWEKALQAINPSIAAPYWDFTLDSTFFGATDWSTSFVFSDDWFGEAWPKNELHTVVQGRWSFVPALTQAEDFSSWTNAYGVMRAPWNADPTPFLTRSGAVYGYANNMKPSGCSEYSIAMRKTSWMSMSRQLNSAAHGHIHELMGGSWGHYFAEAVGNDKSPSVYTFAHEIQALSKVLWRDGYVVCPDQCDMTTAAADCQCMCTEESLQRKSAKDILSETGILTAADFFDNAFHTVGKTQWFDENGYAADPIPGYDVEATEHIYNNLLSMLCNPGHLGDMFQATSTNDITFWVIHSTVDRLWHFKRLGNTANYDETWDPYHKCYGHNPQDVQPFQDMFTPTPSSRRHLLSSADGEEDAGASETAADGGMSGKYLTNMQLYEALHPSSSNLPYAYDNFEWAHCAKLGKKMVNTW